MFAFFAYYQMVAYGNTLNLRLITNNYIMKAKINIQEPCTADWNQMTLVPNGKFCDLCQKNVVDFTDWDTQAIAEYLIQHQSERICGRFKKTQLQETIVMEEGITPILNWDTSAIKKVAAIVVICFGLAITSCNENTPTTPTEPRTDSVINQDTELKVGTASLISDSDINISTDTFHLLVPDSKKITEPDRLNYEDEILGGLGLIPDPESFELGEAVYVEMPNESDNNEQ